MGFHLFLSGIVPSPGNRSHRTIRHFCKSEDARLKLSQRLEVPAAVLTAFLLPVIRLNRLSGVRLKNALRDAGDPRSPEEFIASILVTSACSALPGLLFIPVSPLITTAFLVFAIYYATTGFKDLHRAGKDKSRAIDLELPRFAVYIKQSLNTNRNALLMLERYKTDNSVFAEALSRTIADVKTSNFETALIRFKTRYNSEQLSMIINGLLGIYGGDDVRSYFDLLEKDFTEMEINRLRREIKKIPSKMRISMVVIYAAIAFLFLTPILILIFDNLRLFFA